MKRKVLVCVVLVLTLIFNGFGQNNFDYELSLVPVTVPSLPGLHSYAFAQHEGKWLIIGGRKDGLHARQPFNSFPAAQSNTDIYVVDVANNQFWSSSVNSLQSGMKEQLQSTNMNFYQDGDTLFIIGGYGFSTSVNDHITYPYLTSINVSGLMNAVQASQPVSTFFKQIEDDIFAVTGGHLKKLNNLFYLVGGHRFDGRYNPHGPDHGPGFSQTYTNQIRKFTLNNAGNKLSYSDYSTLTDPVHLRRRDYNLLPQILPDGEQGLMISSGVFQINADLPFLYPVEITESGYTPIPSFNQYLCNYHSAVANMYDETGNLMHSIFFGGISQYYYQNGTLVQDDLVPFVKTISRLTRDANGNLMEYQLPVEMPGLKGAGAEFIPNLSLSHYSNKVLKLHEIDQDSFLIGHIYGGILSPSLNPFSTNQTNTTSADNSIYEVWLKRSPTSIAEFKIDGKNPYDVEVYPNPFKNEFSFRFTVQKRTKVSYLLTNNHGQIILKSENRYYINGDHSLNVDFESDQNSEILYLTVVFDDKYYVTKKLVKN